jgi:hypothetical protein
MVEHIILPAALLVTCVVAIGVCLVYIFEGTAALVPWGRG